MEEIFVVVPLDPPIELRGRLCHWACLNRCTGRVWRSSYRVTRKGAESVCRDLNMNVRFGLIHDPREQESRRLRDWSPGTMH